jgi:hypothetical protein
MRTLVLSAASILAAAKPVTEARSAGFRPKMSLMRAQMGPAAAVARR